MELYISALEIISNFKWFLQMFKQIKLYIYEILQENWVLCNWKTIKVCTHYVDAK